MKRLSPKKGTARIRRIDVAARKLILLNRGQPNLPETLLIDRILDIRGEQFPDDSY